MSLTPSAVSGLQKIASWSPFGDQLNDLSDVQLRGFLLLLAAHL